MDIFAVEAADASVRPGSAALAGNAACALRRIRQRINAVSRFARAFPLENLILFIWL